MNIKKRLYLIIAVVFLVIPEILYSPMINIYYNLLSNGKIFRYTYFQKAELSFIFTILIVQFIGAIYLAIPLKDHRKTSWFFRILGILIFLTLLVIHSFANIGF